MEIRLTSTAYRAASDILRSRPDLPDIEAVVNMVLEDAAADLAGAGPTQMRVPVTIAQDEFDAATAWAARGEEADWFSALVARALAYYLADHPGG